MPAGWYTRLVASLTPCPLHSSHRLAELAALGRGVASSALVGVWLRAGGRPVRLTTYHGHHRCRFLFSRDLGWLLRHCASVAVRIGREIVMLSSDELIRVRALRVVAGIPYLPSLAALGALFPDMLRVAGGVEISLRQSSAEEVLAACARARLPILRTRVIYRRVRPVPSDG